MAYLCPVCEEPQVDASHLANHVAFTAVIRGGDHEAWLDEHVPGWDEDDENALAERLLELDAVESVDHPIDASGEAVDGHVHDHGHQRDPAVDGRPLGGDRGPLDDEAREILADAREMTRQRETGEDAASEGETE